RFRGGGFMDDPRMDRTHKNRRSGEVPVDQLRTDGEGIRRGMRRNIQSRVIVVGGEGEFPCRDPQSYPGLQLCLQRGKQLVRRDLQIAGREGVVETQREPCGRPEADLRRKAVFKEVDLWAV